MQPQPRAWVAAIQIEKRLRAELKKNSFWHKGVRELRTALHHAYESTIFADFQFAQANEVEQQLWKSCFYKPIEEFRSRLRVAQQAAQGVTALAGATREEALEQSAMLTTAYTKFLASAEEAYKRLVARLQWELGDVGASVEVPAGEMHALQQSAPQSPSKGDTAIAIAVHRCLIYLGDICRYRSQVVRPKEEQERALGYYQQAASVLPTSGNPYNQMAVVAYYGSDELRAVYYYFRSLGVSCPFVTARENLLLLFERNRARYAKLPPRPPGPGQGITPGDVATRMVRLAGLMYDRINLEQLTPTRAAAIAALRQLLGEPSFREQLSAAPPANQLLLHAVVIFVFSAQLQDADPAKRKSSGGSAAAAEVPAGETLQKSLLRQAALTTTLELASTLCNALTTAPSTFPSSHPSSSAAAAAGANAGAATQYSIHQQQLALLAALNVLLPWLATHPQLLTLTQGTQPPSPAAPPAAVAAGGGVSLASSAGGAAGSGGGLMGGAMLRELTVAKMGLWRAATRLATLLARAALQQRLALVALPPDFKPPAQPLAPGSPSPHQGTNGSSTLAHAQQPQQQQQQPQQQQPQPQQQQQQRWGWDVGDDVAEEVLLPEDREVRGFDPLGPAMLVGVQLGQQLQQQQQQHEHREQQGQQKQQQQQQQQQQRQQQQGGLDVVMTEQHQQHQHTNIPEANSISPSSSSTSTAEATAQQQLRTVRLLAWLRVLSAQAMHAAQAALAAATAAPAGRSAAEGVGGGAASSNGAVGGGGGSAQGAGGGSVSVHALQAVAQAAGDFHRAMTLIFQGVGGEKAGAQGQPSAARAAGAIATNGPTPAQAKPLAAAAAAAGGATMPGKVGAENGTASHGPEAMDEGVERMDVKGAAGAAAAAAAAAAAIMGNKGGPAMATAPVQGAGGVTGAGVSKGGGHVGDGGVDEDEGNEEIVYRPSSSSSSLARMQQQVASSSKGGSSSMGVWSSGGGGVAGSKEDGELGGLEGGSRSRRVSEAAAAVLPNPLAPQQQQQQQQQQPPTSATPSPSAPDPTRLPRPSWLTGLPSPPQAHTNATVPGTSPVPLPQQPEQQQQQPHTAAQTQQPSAGPAAQPPPPAAPAPQALQQAGTTPSSALPQHASSTFHQQHQPASLPQQQHLPSPASAPAPQQAGTTPSTLPQPQLPSALPQQQHLPSPAPAPSVLAKAAAAAQAAARAAAARKSAAAAKASPPASSHPAPAPAAAPHISTAGNTAAGPSGPSAASHAASHAATKNAAIQPNTAAVPGPVPPTPAAPAHHNQPPNLSANHATTTHAPGAWPVQPPNITLVPPSLHQHVQKPPPTPPISVYQQPQLQAPVSMGSVGMGNSSSGGSSGSGIQGPQQPFGVYQQAQHFPSPFPHPHFFRGPHPSLPPPSSSLLPNLQQQQQPLQPHAHKWGAMPASSYSTDASAAREGEAVALSAVENVLGASPPENVSHAGPLDQHHHQGVAGPGNSSSEPQDLSFLELIRQHQEKQRGNPGRH